MNIFNIFRKKEPPFDESSDCFDAMKEALRKYDEEYGKLDLYIWKLKKQQEEQKKVKEQRLDNSQRYTLKYLYKK